MIDVSRDGAFAVITLNRPEALNALSPRVRAPAQPIAGSWSR